MSRKTIMFVIGLLTAVGAFVADQTGIASINWIAVGAAMLAVVTYFQFQAKLDIQKIAQSHKWKDGKFYAGLLAVIIAQIGAFLGVDLPTAEISAIVTFIMSLLFGKTFKTQPD